MNKHEVDKLFNVPEPKPRTICICGSTKFKDDMMAVAKQKTMDGNIVVMPLVFAHSGDELKETQKIALDGLHLWKIKASSYIVIVCQDFYVGRSTIREMNFAFERKKAFQVWNNAHFTFGFSYQSMKSFAPAMKMFCDRSQEAQERPRPRMGGRHDLCRRSRRRMVRRHARSRGEQRATVAL